MSGSIKLKHASGNGVIIAAPSSNPAADRTLTLPSDADGIIAKTDASGNLTVAGDLTVDTSTLKVDSSNNRVGVGTTSPSHKLHVEDSVSNVIVAKQTTNNGGYNTFTGVDSFGNVKFYASHNGRVGASEGIIFGSDTAAGNVLDDYEEGEHTITTNSNLTAHSSYNKADYTKVGNMVTVTFLLYVQGVSGSDTVTVSLPFANRNESVPRMCQAVGSVMHKGVNTGNVGIIPYLDAGSSSLKFYELNDDGSWLAMENSDLSVADEMYVTITYKTAT